MARGRGRQVLALAIGTCAAPVAVLLGAIGSRTGLWSAPFAHETIGWTVGPVLAAIGLVLGVIAAVTAWRTRSGRLAGVVAIAVAAVVAGVYGWRYSALEAGPDAATTSLAEVPPWGPLSGRRGAGGPDGFATCPTAVAAPTQAAPEVVVYVLQQYGVTVVRAGVTGVYGVQPGFWFGLDRDVAVRIRPGRTDIRVAARDQVRHDGGACRLAARIAADLTPR